MNILITGGLGYIGGRIVDFFLDSRKEYNITVTTTRKNPKLPEKFKKIAIRQANILDKKRLIELCKGMDYIIHLAAANEVVSAKDPHLALKITTEGTLNILEAAKKNNVKKFMYFSTFHIYGPHKSKRISEECLPNPVHPYSLTHYMAELFVNQYRQIYDFETIVLRLSNSFGAPITPDVDRWTLVVNDLCLQAVKYRKLELKSSGKQHRDFIPMKDVIQAVDLLMRKPYEKLGDGIFNVGSGKSTSIIEMCSKIKDVYTKYYGKDLPIIIPKDVPKQDDTPVDFDISKIQKLGFKPSQDYETEILNTLKLCEKKVENDSSEKVSVFEK